MDKNKKFSYMDKWIADLKQIKGSIKGSHVDPTKLKVVKDIVSGYCNITKALKSGVDELDIAALEKRGYDPMKMSVQDMKDALVDEGIYEDVSLEKFNTQQDLINESL